MLLHQPSVIKRALYVSSFFPDDQAHHAGGRVAFENLLKLQFDGYIVDIVVCTTENHEITGNKFSVIKQRPASLLRYILKNFGSLPFRTIMLAPILHTRLNLEAEAVIFSLMTQNQYCEVFVDFTQTWLLVQRSMERASITIPATLCMHDIFVQRALRSSRPYERLLIGAVIREEQHLLRTLDRALVLNPKDRDLVRALYGMRNIAIKPFIPPAWCAHVRRAPKNICASSIVFFGNFERIENSSAARWFVSEALGRIRVVHPRLTLTLIGSGSDLLAKAIGDGLTVIGTGFVEDPSSFFSRCVCAIAPLFEGAGVKFKVLEALAAGVPVIGTSIALEGIESEPNLILAEPSEFVDCLIDFLNNNSVNI